MFLVNFIKKHISDIFVIIVIIMLLYFIVNFKNFWPIILPFLIAIFFSYLVKPLVDVLEISLKSRGVAILLTFIIIFGLLAVIIIYFIPSFFTEIDQLIQNIPIYFKLINQWLTELNTKVLKQFNVNIKDMLSSNIVNVEAITKQLLNKTFGVVKVFYANIIYYLLIPIISYYILRDWSKIAKWLKWLLPEKYRKEGLSIINDVNKVLHQYIRAQLIDAFIIGILSFLGFSLLSVKYAAVLGIITGIGNLIPYFGPIISSIPSLIIAFSDSSLKAILTAAFLLILQQIDSIFISPRVIGSRLGLHPLTVIISLLISNKLFGFISMFFAVPAVAVLKIIIINILEKKQQKKV